MSLNTELLELLRPITVEEQEHLNGRHEINPEIYGDNSSMMVDSRRLLKNGELIRIRTHTRFVHFPKHRHNFVEVIYMCSGSTRQVINGNEMCLQQGELLFLSQNATQEIFPAGIDDIAVNFMILPSFFDTTLSMLGGSSEENPLREFLVGCLCGNAASVGYLHFKVADLLPVQNLIENMIWSLVYKNEDKRGINQATMGLLFLQLLDYTDRMSSYGMEYSQELLLRILEYIERSYQSGTLSELSASVNQDIFWMSRMIKRLTGKTYTQLVQQKRLQMTALLLRETHLSIAEIGQTVGYENLSYFHRIFKNSYGVTPHEYRINYLQIRT